MSLDLILPAGLLPAEIGLPEKFTEFRNIQRELVDFALCGPNGDYETRRFMCAGIAPGGGKSLGAHAIGVMAGVKYVVLTATINLENQNVRDGYDIVNIRGRRNYTCRDEKLYQKGRVPTCEEGYHEECRWAARSGCDYFETSTDASAYPRIVTNYQYWMNVRARNRSALEASGPVGMLICDEAHKAFTELSRFLGTWFSLVDLHKYAKERTREAQRDTKDAEWGRVGTKWLDALTEAWGGVSRRMEVISKEFESEAEAARRSKEYQALAKVESGLQRVVSLANDGQGEEKSNWIWRKTAQGYAFDCIWPARYAERYLWSGVEKVVMLSATLRPKSLSLNGIKASERYFKEWSRVFPAHNNPVYYIPTGKMGKNSQTGDDRRNAYNRAAEIFREWGHLKGMVQTPSYKLARQFQENVPREYAEAMIVHETGEAEKAMEDYLGREGPVVLVSPSFTTGWDVDACEWIHIPKLPFPDKSDPVILARMESDDDIYNHETMQPLVQGCGRGTRTPASKCTVMVTDNAVGNFRRYAADHAPRWFRVMDAPGGRVPKAPRVAT